MSTEDNITEEAPVSLPFDLENVPELHAVPAGEEKLRLTRVATGQGKKGDYILLTQEVANDSNAKDIRTFLSLPNAEDDPKSVNRKRRAVVDALTAYSIPAPAGQLSAQVLSDHMAQYVGSLAWALLSSKDEGDTYGEQNSVKRYTKSA